MDMDELQQVLLEQIAGDGGGAATLSLPDILEQSMGDDPVAGPLVAALRRREAAQSAAPPEPEPYAVDPVVNDVLERLYAELEELRARVATLADALGACRRCWGEDPYCAVCRGRGRPGGRASDPLLFDVWVAPAVRRCRQNPSEPAGAGTHHHQPGDPHA
jgi:hypothetical protein